MTQGRYYIEPIQFSDCDLVEIKTTNNCDPTPHCKKHGAMNKTTMQGIWRCITVTGFTKVKEGNSIGQIHKENICRAGCMVVEF